MSEYVAKTRQSNLELLRIIALVMIIGHHIAFHSGFDFGYELSINRFLIQFLNLGGKVGVNIFVLISGYFLINQSKIRIAKIFRFVAECLLYSVLITLIFSIFQRTPLGIKEIIKMLFPITFRGWWFASVYFIMYLLSPYMNRLLKALTKDEYRVLLLLLFIIWCIIPTFTTSSFSGNELTWFLFLYCCAAYVRLYYDDFRKTSTFYILIGLIVYLLTFLSSIVFDLLGREWQIFINHDTYFFGMDKLPVFVCSVLLFIGFSKMTFHNRVINIVASTTFGIYLIHDSLFVRQFLWVELFKNASYQNTSILILYCLMEIVVVFIACSVIDYIRIIAIEKPIVSKMSHRAEDAITVLFEKVKTKYKDKQR